MTTSRHPSLLAFAPESEQGTPPADATAWVSEGTRLRHIGESLDVAGVGQAVVEDMRSQLYVYGLNQRVRGLRNTEFPFDAYLTGQGAATTATNQIAALDLATVLGHCLGGHHRSNTTVVTGGTALEPIVTSVTNIAVGCLVFFVDTSAADNLPHPRRVVAIDTLTLTLDQELSFTPANGDVCHAMHTLYDDESVLVNSAVGPTTLSWLAQKGLAAALENFQFMGCKSQLSKIALGRGALPLLNFRTLAANFLAPDEAPNPSWVAAPSGHAPVAIGPRTEWQYQTAGDDAANVVHCYSFDLEVGVPVVPIDTNGEVQDNMQGRQAYTTAPGDTIIKLGMDFTNAAWTDFDASTLKYLRFSKLAPAGQLITLYFPSCELANSPKRGINGDVSAVDLELRSHPNTSGATALERAKVLIGIG
jgi:hypothetical protein